MDHLKRMISEKGRNKYISPAERRGDLRVISDRETVAAWNIKRGNYSAAKQNYSDAAVYCDKIGEIERAEELRAKAKELVTRTNTTSYPRIFNLNSTSQAIASLVMIILGVLFLSPDITGDVINEGSKIGVNFFGAMLILLGITGLYMSFAKKHKL